MNVYAAAVLAVIGAYVAFMAGLAYQSSKNKPWALLALIAVGVIHCLPALFLLWIEALG